MKPTPKKGNQPQNQIQQQQLTVTKHYQGVIPPPEMMEQFKNIDPSFPDRILKMAENEGFHRRELAKSVTYKSFLLDFSGIISGIAVVSGVIWLCYEFVKRGYATQAASLGIAVLVGLAVVFATRKQPKNLNNGNGK